MSVIDIAGLPMPPEWTVDALCAQVDPELFFPKKGGSDNANAARAVCAACDVSTQCLAWAMKTADSFGIYGGLTARERKRVRICKRCDRRAAAHMHFCGELCRKAARKEARARWEQQRRREAAAS